MRVTIPFAEVRKGLIAGGNRAASHVVVFRSKDKPEISLTDHSAGGELEAECGGIRPLTQHHGKKFPTVLSAQADGPSLAGQSDQRAFSTALWITAMRTVAKYPAGAHAGGPIPSSAALTIVRNHT